MPEELYTLKELAEKAGVSYPTACNYKRDHQDRIPSVGSGRTQRYPRKAVSVFKAIRQENEGKSGRRSAGSEQTADELLTLQALADQSGVSLATAQRYSKQHLDRLPHVGKGRKRRYKPEAVDVMRQIRAGSDGTVKRVSARSSTASIGQVAKQLRQLQRAHEALLRKVDGLSRTVSKPIQITLQR